MGALLAGAAAVTALLVTTAVAPDGRVVLTPDPEASAGTPGTAGGAANARRILLAAASAAARTSDEPGAYWRTRTSYMQRFLSPDRRYLLQRGLSEEVWLEISRQTKKYHALDPQREMDDRLQGACMEILMGLPVSPEVRASAYRILAELPGITAVGEVTDALGRTGQGLTYQAGEKGADVTMVVDPGSGLFLSTETRSAGVDAGGRTVTVGTFAAYDDSSWTDEEPDLPARHD